MAIKKSAAPRRAHRPDNIRTFKVQADGTLLATMATLLPDHNQTKLKSMLRHNQFAINGTPSSQFDREVRRGDEIQVNFDRSFGVFSHPKIKLVFEDDDIIVVDKGYGVLSTGTERVKDDTVFSVLRKYVKQNNVTARIYVVHRLDRDTSGLMILAKNETTQQALLHNWSQLVLDRKYVAVVEGYVQAETDTLRSYLTEDEDGYRMYSTDDANKGKLATTNFRVMERGRRATMLEVWLKVGHKNQIRVHMSEMGNPVSGDRKYGGHPNAIHRLALHASELHFVHPITRKEMRFTLPAPSEFATLLK